MFLLRNRLYYYPYFWILSHQIYIQKPKWAQLTTVNAFLRSEKSYFQTKMAHFEMNI